MTMRHAISVAFCCAVALLCATSAFAQGNVQGNKGEIDPAAVSDGLKAIFSHTAGNKGTRERLNANTVTVMTGTIGGTYVQFGADLASVLTAKRPAFLCGKAAFFNSAEDFSSRGGVRETVALELLAQRGLQDLAGRGVRNAVDENDIIGHPPFGDLAVHEFQDVLARRLLAGLELDDQERTLVPFGMIDADHGRFRDRGVGDREVFQIDRRNPFAAGLDDVL